MHVIRTKEEGVSEQVRKGQRSFFHPNSVAAVTTLPACGTSVWGGQVSAWQAVSGLVSLQEEHRSGAKPPGLQSALPVERPTLHSLLAGGKSGSHWGVGLPTQELHPSNPWEVGKVPPAGFYCQLTRQRRGKRGDRGQEERGEGRGGRAVEERRRMTRG